MEPELSCASKFCVLPAQELQHAAGRMLMVDQVYRHSVQILGPSRYMPSQ